MRLSIACSSFVLVGSMLVAMTGCAAREEEEEGATETTTAALQAGSQYGVTESVIEDTDAAPDPETLAQKIVDRPARNLEPASCATKTRSGSVVTLVLSNCTGPYGRAVVSGTLTATLSKTAADVVHVTIASSDDFVANGKPLHLATTSDVRYEGSKRFVTHHGESRGTTKRGRAFDRQSDATITADVEARCADIAGHATGTVAGASIDTTIEGLRVCRDACPASGLAKATVKTARGRERSMEIRFDGSDEAQVVGFRGREFSVALACGDAEAAE